LARPNPKSKTVLEATDRRDDRVLPLFKILS
jgi:hypothetical protein